MAEILDSAGSASYHPANRVRCYKGGHMRRRRSMLLVAALISSVLMAIGSTPAGAAGPTRKIPSAGTTAIRSTAAGPDVIQAPEFRAEADDAELAGVANRIRPEYKDKGPFPKRPLEAPGVGSSPVAGANPELSLSFAGLNHRDQRLANSGNQFSIEPPDQALCVGNGYAVEAVNSVLRVFSSATGATATGVQDLNTFFGYPAAINRADPTAPNAIGPNVIDPVCLFDADMNRFVVAITTLLVDSAGNANGKNTIDLAVSNSGDPTGSWTIYHVAAQNDGTDGTPNHGCTRDGSTPGPCFQDYPHIGADRYGVYISTNEYDLFGPNYSAAQIFAFAKTQLAAHPAAIDMTLVEDLSVAGTPGFTVWPAISPPGQASREANGTEYFLSTIAGDGSETGNPTGTARKMGVWALSNTRSLQTASPSLRMSSKLIDSPVYVFPPAADQKPGDFPLGQCLNDNSNLFGPGLGCWFLLLDGPPTWQPEVESKLDSSDTRMQQTTYVDGMLWGAASTAVQVRGKLKAGIVWVGVKPETSDNGKVDGEVKRQGYIALAGNNLTYPALAMRPDGTGAIAFTVVGETHYPSAGYATITDKGKVGPIHIAAEGAGPSDGFTSYKALVGDSPTARWGDYGAAVTDGRSIWIASEYIAQSCSLDIWLSGAIGSCGGTRTALGNWATRLSKLNP